MFPDSYGIGGPGMRGRMAFGGGMRAMAPGSPPPAPMAAAAPAREESRKESPAEPEAKADNGKDSLARNKAKSPDAADQPTADKSGDSGSTLRSNFSETEFFVPQLLTEKDGSAAIEFTVPDLSLIHI